MHWIIVDSGIQDAQTLMDRDAQLLKELSQDPILHFYDWRFPSLTHGYFTAPSAVLNLDQVQRLGWDIARRPTGGGVTFHSTDFAFSLLIPATHPAFSSNPLQNYATINQALSQALSQLTHGIINASLQINADDGFAKTSSFCMARPTQYDLVVGKKKLAGAAQRKTKKGFLHQGSISLEKMDRSTLTSVLKERTFVEAIDQHTFSLANILGTDIPETRKLLRQLISTLQL